MYTIPQIILIAKVCQYLADMAIRIGKETDKLLAIKLYVERKSVEWAYDQDSTDTTLTKTSNYLFALCGGYAFEAIGIIGANTGGIVPSPSGGSTLTPYPINITISAGQSGVSTLQDSDWIGLQDLNTIFINQNVLQSGYQFTFNSITGTIDVSLYGYVFQTGDVITGIGFIPNN